MQIKIYKSFEIQFTGAAYGEQDVKIATEGKELKVIEDFFLYLESVSGEDSPHEQDILLTKEV